MAIVSAEQKINSIPYKKAFNEFGKIIFRDDWSGNELENASLYHDEIIENKLFAIIARNGHAISGIRKGIDKESTSILDHIKESIEKVRGNEECREELKKMLNDLKNILDKWKPIKLEVLIEEKKYRAKVSKILGLYGHHNDTIEVSKKEHEMYQLEEQAQKLVKKIEYKVPYLYITKIIYVNTLDILYEEYTTLFDDYAEYDDDKKFNENYIQYQGLIECFNHIDKDKVPNNAMAISKYDYDTNKEKNDSVQKIAKSTENQGIKVSDRTIRKYLSEAKELKG